MPTPRPAALPTRLVCELRGAQTIRMEADDLPNSSRSRFESGHRTRVSIPLSLLSCLLLGLIATTGCSIKKLAVGSVANQLSSGPDVFASDDDPELVRDALPFGLKFVETLLVTVPDHQGLLLTACRGYTQYSFAYVELDALAIEPTDRARATELRARARKLYLRGR